MKVKPFLPLLAAVVVGLLASTLTPRPAHTQQRDVRLSQTAASGGGRYYALVIGNNDYASLPKLKTASADAREVERVLRESYGFQTKSLLNANRAQIMAALSAYRRELDADASLLIYYAGHGYRDDEADKTYWLPVDATLEDVTNWIIADQITAAIRVIPARHVLVVSDSCYSGTLTRGLSVSPTRPSEREQFLQKMAAGRSRTLMASGGDEPVADGGGSGHSVFAAAFLRGLRQMDKPQFTGAELFNHYVIEAVAGRADQTPEYNPLRGSGHEAGDFVFARVGPAGRPTETIAGGSASPAPTPWKFEPPGEQGGFARMQDLLNPAPPQRPSRSDMPGRSELRALVKTIKEVETDQAGFLGKEFVINGTIELSSYYNYGFASDVFYAYQMKDRSNEVIGAAVYIRRDNQSAAELRQRLLSAKGNSMKAACLVIIMDKRTLSASGIHAELIGCTQPF